MASIDNGQLIISTDRFPKFSDISEFLSHYRCLHCLFLIGWMCWSLQFPKLTEDALDIIERELVLQFPLSKGNRRNPPVLVWQNSCTSLLPILSIGTSALKSSKLKLEDGWSIVAIFQRKRGLVSLVWGNCHGPLKISGGGGGTFCPG